MTQNQQVLSHLKRKPITQLDAWKEYKIFRLGARIKNLEDMGYTIPRKTIRKDGKNWTMYLGIYK
jgi:hypothetical protein